MDRPGLAAPDPLVGTVLGGAFRVERPIGCGGMGRVYEATQLRLDKRVAVKVLAPYRFENADGVARFRREALVTSTIGHPHIVQVLDFNTAADGQPYLVMELLEGETLSDRLRRLGRMPSTRVARLVQQISAALSAAHANGVVHRDLKPGNVFLIRAEGTDDFVKVLDFGISKVLVAESQLTQSPSLVGTPHYMSPEQAQGLIEQIDERTDQWALACIAWECLSGERPFSSPDVPSLLYRIVHLQPPSLQSRVPELHRSVEGVLLRALAKARADRYASVADFARTLESALSANEMSEAMLQPSLGSTIAELYGASAGRPRRVRRWLGAVAFCLAAGAVVAIVWSHLPARSRPDVRNDVREPTARQAGSRALESNGERVEPSAVTPTLPMPSSSGPGVPPGSTRGASPREQALAHPRAAVSGRMRKTPRSAGISPDLTLVPTARSAAEINEKPVPLEGPKW